MSVEDAFKELNMNNIKMLFLFATVLLIIALIQKVNPAFSITYHFNSKPSYVKAKFIAKLLTSATMYISGIYVYYFTDLTKSSMCSAYAFIIPYILYHVYKWGLVKLIDFRNKNKEEQLGDSNEQ
jgi:Sec-independent protein secretion pathway component TatC